MSKKWYRKPVYLLTALALVLSLGVIAVPTTGTVEANTQATEVWVDDDYYDGGYNDGHTWDYDAFDNIQDAIDAVADDGTVHVAEGEYTGFYIVERSGISVVGTEGTIVDDPPYYGEELIPYLAFTANSTAITIESIDFQYPVIESAAPNGFGDFSQSLIIPVVAGIGCFNSTGNISSVTVSNMAYPTDEGPPATGIFVMGGDIEETVTISDSTVENCTMGVWVLADHVILDNCSISGVPIEDYGSWGIFAMLAMVDMVNCNISGCQGGWEWLQSAQEGFGLTEELFAGSGVFSIFTDLRMNGCTISNNDVGIVTLSSETSPFDQPSGSFSNYATDNFRVDHDFGLIDDVGSLIANLNNIAGNEYFGLLNCANTTAEATNNWWGSVNGPEWLEPGPSYSGYDILPEFEGSPETGDTVAGNVTYEPWLGAPLSLPAVHQQSLDAGEIQVVAEEAGTTVTVTTTGATNITVAAYESQPFPDEEFPDETLGKYIDIYVSNPEVVIWPIRVELSYTDAEASAAGVDESSLGLYYYQEGTGFHRCSSTGANPSQNFIWANLTQAEAGCLAGSPFGTGGQPRPVGGEAYPVNKLAILAPWIALLAAIIAGTTIFIRRRRAQG